MDKTEEEIKDIYDNFDAKIMIRNYIKNNSIMRNLDIEIKLKFEEVKSKIIKELDSLVNSKEFIELRLTI